MAGDKGPDVSKEAGNVFSAAREIMTGSVFKPLSQLLGGADMQVSHAAMTKLTPSESAAPPPLEIV